MVLTRDAVASQSFNVGPLAAGVHLRITLHAPDRRRRDVDNLIAALKPSLDGVFGAVGVDDANARSMEIISSRELAARGRVVVELRASADVGDVHVREKILAKNISVEMHGRARGDRGLPIASMKPLQRASGSRTHPRN